MQELILDLRCEEKDNEPYFRHIVKKWTREYNPDAFEVEVHNNMYTEAAKILRKLPEVLEAKYGKKAAEALTYSHQEIETIESQEISVITLDTEDRYMNGGAQFIFTGLETLAQTTQNHTTQIEERSMNVKSTTSGLTGHQTVGSRDMMEPHHMDVDAGIGSTPPTNGVTEPPDGGWTQVGSEADKKKLQRQVSDAMAPNPGGNQGRQYP